jgi:hypothetical protein
MYLTKMGFSTFTEDVFNSDPEKFLQFFFQKLQLHSDIH